MSQVSERKTPSCILNLNKPDLKIPEHFQSTNEKPHRRSTAWCLLCGTDYYFIQNCSVVFDDSPVEKYSRDCKLQK